VEGIKSQPRRWENREGNFRYDCPPHNIAKLLISLGGNWVVQHISSGYFFADGDYPALSDAIASPVVDVVNEIAPEDPPFSLGRANTVFMFSDAGRKPGRNYEGSQGRKRRFRDARTRLGGQPAGDPRASFDVDQDATGGGRS